MTKTIAEQLTEKVIDYFEDFAEHDMADKMKEIVMKDLNRIFQRLLGDSEPVGNVFELPLRLDKGDYGEWWIVDKNNKNIAEKESPEAIIHAVNSHDTLVEQLEMAGDLIRELMWGVNEFGLIVCDSCNKSIENGHSDNCEVNNFLTLIEQGGGK